MQLVFALATWRLISIILILILAVIGALRILGFRFVSDKRIESKILQFLQQDKGWMTQDSLYVSLGYRRERVGAALRRLSKDGFIDRKVDNMNTTPYREINEYFRYHKPLNQGG